MAMHGRGDIPGTERKATSMAKLHRHTGLKAGTAFLGILWLCASTAIAQDAKSFADVLKSQTLTIVVGSPPGGAYDLYARLIARFMGAHLPGAPSTVVRNMPGGGGYEAANYLAVTAPKDGTTIATFSRGVPMQPLVDKTGVRFDPLTLEWIGSPSNEVSLGLSWHSSPVKTFADLRAKGMTVGTTGPATDTNVFPRVVANVLGVPLKMVSGYRGAADILLAVERGEVDGAFGISWSALWPNRKDWIETGKINYLVQLALEPGPERLAGVPLVSDLATNAEDRRVLEVIFARQTMAYPFAAPPGVTADRLDVLRKAFVATLADPKFLAETERSGMSVKPVSPERMREIVRRVYDSPPQVVERIKAMMKPGEN
jgi:tripartite-type tricarboxylate transporter receptor subunit TctC